MTRKMNRRSTILVTIIVLTIIVVAASVAYLLMNDEPNYAPTIDPANFVSGIDNEFFPLTPGTVLIYEGVTDEGTEHIEVNVTHETRVILGVTCTVVNDTVWINGEIAELTYDWYAQDTEGNVWYFGEDSKEYADGVVVSTEGSWEAGVDGAKPGIVMEANPIVGDEYRQEYYKGEAEDMAEVLALDVTVNVTSGTFTGCLQTKEWTPLENDIVENKYYAPGIGMVLETMVEGGADRIELVQIISPP